MLLSGHSQAQDFKTRLAEAPSTDAIRKFYARFSGLGTVRRHQFQSDGVQFLTLWVSTPEQAQMFLWAYQRVGQKWVLLVDHPQTAKDAGAECVQRCFGDLFILPHI